MERLVPMDPEDVPAVGKRVFRAASGWRAAGARLGAVAGGLPGGCCGLMTGAIASGQVRVAG